MVGFKFIEKTNHMKTIEEKYVSKEELFNVYYEWYQIFSVIHIRERVRTLDSIKLYIYSEEGINHHTPHLHAYYQNKSIIIDLINIKVIDGTIPLPQQKKALKWVKDHKDFLTDKWNELNSGICIPVI